MQTRRPGVTHLRPISPSGILSPIRPSSRVFAKYRGSTILAGTKAGQPPGITSATGAVRPLSNLWWAATPRRFWKRILLAEGEDDGDRGVHLFHNYSMTPTALAVALEQRGFDSL